MSMTFFQARISTSTSKAGSHDRAEAGEVDEAARGRTRSAVTKRRMNDGRLCTVPLPTHPRAAA